MEEYRNMSDQELLNEARELDEIIYVVECYGVSDMRRMSEVCNELNRRGYEPVEVHKQVEWIKKEVETE